MLPFRVPYLDTYGIPLYRRGSSVKFFGKTQIPSPLGPSRTKRKTQRPFCECPFRSAVSRSSGYNHSRPHWGKNDGSENPIRHSKNPSNPFPSVGAMREASRKLPKLSSTNGKNILANRRACLVSKKGNIGSVLSPSMRNVFLCCLHSYRSGGRSVGLGVFMADGTGKRECIGILGRRRGLRLHPAEERNESAKASK